VRLAVVGLAVVGLAVVGLAVVGLAVVGLAVVGLAVVGLAVVGPDVGCANVGLPDGVTPQTLEFPVPVQLLQQHNEAALLVHGKQSAVQVGLAVVGLAVGCAVMGTTDN